MKTEFDSLQRIARLLFIVYHDCVQTDLFVQLKSIVAKKSNCTYAIVNNMWRLKQSLLYIANPSFTDLIMNDYKP